MTQNEVMKIIAILEVSYPQHYSKLNNEQMKNQLLLWCELWKDTDANLIANTVKSMINGDINPFPPTIGQINAKAYELFEPKVMTEQEAWNTLYKAICNSGYNAQYEYDHLPLEIKPLCTPSQLREWANMNVDTLNSVVSSNFMRSFKAKEKQRIDYDKLPNETKSLISELNMNMKLENKGE